MKDDKRFQGKSVLILGSGGLKIGQAGEFDYSGTQAIKALKEEKIHTILINPNVATVQTDPCTADETYLLPLDVEIVSQIIAKTKPSGILLSFGGQTALNLGLQLASKNIFQKYGVEILGTNISSIQLTEDRHLFKKKLESIGICTPKSRAVKSIAQALKAAEELGYPVMLRLGFSLGGLGSGKITNPKELHTKAQEALNACSQILIEEYLFGFKELEYEIVRDQYGNALTICNMENLDPMGIHTGESIVVAPSQTLNNQEYHLLRSIALKAAEAFEIVGECNIQYALNPKDGSYRVIEMNARLSRSSALASKATGYPLAFVAAKLSLGFSLAQIRNSVTKKTTAFFEPALDYIVVKIPRWDTHKLRSAERKIGTEMKSVGEVMAIGRSFPEALQKAIRMLNIGADGLTSYPYPIENLSQEIHEATDRRLFALALFFEKGATLKQAQALCQIDPWFLLHIQSITQLASLLKKQPLTKGLLRKAKQYGFSDQSIGKIKNISQEKVRKLRHRYQILPMIKQIDTLAGEFDAKTNYLFLSYHGICHDIQPFNSPPIIVLGSGPYSIGSSVEFDWCAVNTCRELRSLEEKTMIINCNPETVSTDYDESDRLYFEELTFERVRDIADFESPKGIIVSVGGQIANNLSIVLNKYGYPLLGTKAWQIDRAENRYKFSSLLHKLKIDQPTWVTVVSLTQAKSFASQVGYPVLIRPSYVLSGSAMNIVFSEDDLAQFLIQATKISPDYPVVLSKFITEAKELEVDGVAKEGRIIIEAISEHIENAGVHSGDATVVLPPQNLDLETIRRTKLITRQIVKALEITGPFNIQFVVKGNAIQVIECNLRASRSFPFVSKVTRHNFIEIATRALLNQPISGVFKTLEFDYVGVKTPQFSYQRLKGASPVAHVEMASTGEVACLGRNLQEAFFLSWMATQTRIKGKKILFSIGGNKKSKLLESIKALADCGWKIFATQGTHDFLKSHQVESQCTYKRSQKKQPHLSSFIKKRYFDLIINIPKGTGANPITDGFHIRRLSIDHHIPLITNLQNAQVFLSCLVKLNLKSLLILPWQCFATISEKDLINRRAIK
ncbi:carbamoyl-phosphate synthase (glutamine-hydrolyzing) large subunit [Candidatus Rhabdochlamydia sp. T3358]|uniref:carbamoyl-phosphate synthase (glutamine-hydrolyzing) large subunit n=1 Tax=Candidatus Rhabdochlamydia sp. T3358 TaxID=2099795 RepID=UPI0010BB7A14|nr:carbamoyl-phosphate synthase (glutamine-hydrolyzing) large subunit [Candidatus Rhabdochlamydia sp. T3358]VHO00752.1 Carbamoyl-phosphate synthase large chain [Candidatus Rhabdochlamydia sp. T3358]